MTNPQTTDWLDNLVEQILVARPKGEIIVSSGHSPSGTYHVGTLREVMTANAITWAIRRAGRDAKHVDFVDDFDAFRKVPLGIGVPESWSQYLGQPLRVVPDPFECHESYGAHFVTDLYEGLAAIGATPDETLSGYDLYKAGTYAEQIETALAKLDDIRHILTDVGGRQLDERWSPVQILSDSNNLRQWKYAGYNARTKMVSWTDGDGATGELPIDTGRIKLDWRLDWPARWAKWGVDVEPFGRDHATKGGSYDTGRVLVSQIFGGEAPVPVPYEFIMTVGETKKMSKSSGNVLTPKDALEVMPPELLRYFIVKNRPGRTLNFDAGVGLYTLIDEYVRERGSSSAGIAYANSVLTTETLSDVPFSHLVAVSQAVPGNTEAIYEVLARTGYAKQVQSQRDIIARELVFVANWLAKHAPDSVKFSLQADLPAMELSEAQQALLGNLAVAIQTNNLDAEGMHLAIYSAAETHQLTPAQAFQALYRVLLNQDSGPKAGWFLASLAEQDKPWLVKRLKAASAPRAEVSNAPKSLEAVVGGKTIFAIDPKVVAAFAQPYVGYVVADITVNSSGDQDGALAQVSLANRGITKDTITAEPLIAVWRDVYRSFGVKPSDYRSSVEALVRRELDGKPASVNSIVDLYNLVSVRNLLPMGAMDLDHVHGTIRLRFGKVGETADLLGKDKPVDISSKHVVYADDDHIITWLWNHRDAKDTAVTTDTKHAIFFIDSVSGSEVVQTALDELIAGLEALPGNTVLASGVIG
ncbi:lysine--tRNA ligase [Candidatus Saccharibacteria bacterium]|nr:lysine--tRNA ligase [Candidatus Saccharibacteria bacterium]